MLDLTPIREVCLEDNMTVSCRSVATRGAQRYKIELSVIRALYSCSRMEDAPRLRLPLHHPDCIRARDIKLQQRDEKRAQRNALTRYQCPCNLCGGRRRPYKVVTVARHLRHRGRHGALRGWTAVRAFPQLTSSLHCKKCVFANFWT